MAEIDNMNIPDRVIKPITHGVSNINMGDLQIPPVLIWRKVLKLYILQLNSYQI